MDEQERTVERDSGKPVPAPVVRLLFESAGFVPLPITFCLDPDGELAVYRSREDTVTKAIAYDPHLLPAAVKNGISTAADAPCGV